MGATVRSAAGRLPALVVVLSLAVGCTGAPARKPTATSVSVAPTASAMSTARPPEIGGGPAKQLALNFKDDKERRRAVGLGYNLIDTDPDERQVNRLPEEAQAMVWAGNAGCGEFDLAWPAFTRVVDRFARSPRVYGYFLADEPTSRCPQVIAEIKRRAAYVKVRAPHQKRFISANARDYAAAVPARLGVDYVGIDAYGCRAGDEKCDADLIRDEVEKAVAAGIPRTVLIPKFQTFGQGCAEGADGYRMPTEKELIDALVVWHDMVPNPVFEVVYSWSNQKGISCPTLADADGEDGRPDLQRVLKRHNDWHNDGRHGDKLLEPTLR